MSEINECYAYFHITGSFNPADITNRVGIVPTRASVQGDPIPRTQMLRKCSRWSLESRLQRSAALELHVADVLDQLDNNRVAFQKLSAEFGGVMELVGYFRAYYPGLFFENTIVQRLAEYQLAIDCDFYFSDSSEPPSGTVS
jgi:hypothetical protein